MLHDPKWKIKHDAKQLLFDAANYLEAHGWCQGVMRRKNSVCLFGAIRAVHDCAGFTAVAVENEAVYRLRIATGTIGKSYSIAGWNDQPGRTKQEVIDALRGAAR